MSRADDLAVEIQEIVETIRKLNKKLRIKHEERAELVARYKPGDVLRRGGYYNKGDWLVEKVVPRDYGGMGYALIVRKINKDGQPGKVVNQFDTSFDIDECNLLGRFDDYQTFREAEEKKKARREKRRDKV